MGTALLVAAMACQSLDLGTTLVGLSRGGREANPVLGQSPTRIVAIKVGVNVGALLLHRRIDGPRKHIVTGTLAGAGCLAGTMNLRTLRDRR